MTCRRDIGRMRPSGLFASVRLRPHRSQHTAPTPNPPLLAPTLLFCLLLCTPLLACSSSDSSQDEATGASFSPAQEVALSSFDQDAAYSENDGSIDMSHVDQGWVAASATSTVRLKFQVSHEGQDYNYDLPADGTALVCPINMGDGSYDFSILRNVQGNEYVRTTSCSAVVSLASEFAPYLVPNVYCNYDADSNCVSQARQLVSNASNQGEAVRSICEWIADNISYDTDKANELEDATGYVPDPDETLAAGSGICFDFASLGAAMLRSQSIPAQVVTGYVSPSNIYHAWIMVYIDGSWHSAQFSVDANQWSRIDLTFASAGAAEDYVGDGKSYNNRYVY